MPVNMLMHDGGKSVRKTTPKIAAPTKKNILPVTGKSGIVAMPGKGSAPVKKSIPQKGSPRIMPKQPLPTTNSKGIVKMPGQKTNPNKKATPKTSIPAAKEPIPTVKQGVVQMPNTNYKKGPSTTNKKAPTVTVKKTTPAPAVKAPTNKTTTPKVPAPTNNGTKPTTTVTPPTSTNVSADTKRLGTLWGQAAGYKGQINDLLTKGFSYNPETDPSYLAIQTLAQKNAKVASRGAMETMNDRGILNSTVTGDRLGQIEQTAQDAVTAQIPQLQAAAYSQYNDKLGHLYNMMNGTYDEAYKERTFGEDQRQFNTNFGENQRQYDLSRGDNNSQWNKDYDLRVRGQNFTENQAAINNAQQDRGLDLQEANYSLNELKSIQDQGSFTDQKATQGALSEMLQFKDAESALDYLNKNASRFYQGGADLTELINTMDKRFSGFGAKAAQNNNGNISFSK